MTDEDLDPRRLLVAAHELGHYLVWREAGLPVRSIRVTGRGRGAVGEVDLGPSPLRSEADMRAWMVGLWAGRAAGIKWGDEHPEGPRQREGNCSADLAAYRRYRRDNRHQPEVRAITPGLCRATAARLVRAHWSQIEKLAPKLAARGRL